MLIRRIFGIGQLGRRLALAFVAVALAAIVVNAAISAQIIGADVGRVVKQQEASLSRAVALTAGAAFQGIGWENADLKPAFNLASQAEAAVQVRDLYGRVVASSPGFSQMSASTARTRPIFAQGRQVGRATTRFGPQAAGEIARDIEARRWQSRVLAAGVAAAIALVVSVLVARAITGPLELLLEAVRARGAGGRSVRIMRVRGIGVIRELLESFNKASNTLDEQDRIQRNLVADVAHELRTPVAVLQASHEAMLDGVTDPTPENLESLREEVLRLARMVDDLQRLAAAEAAALQLTLSPQDLGAIAGEAAGNLGDSFSNEGVTLVRRLDEAHVRCDADRMREVVSNLLTNALKFTPRGGTVELETGVRPDGLAAVQVSDTGIGIAADELPHVTERFFRGPRSPGVAPGSGIGLTIVSELVRAHGGELEIASEQGHGTLVTVTLPAIDPAESRRLALLRSAAGQPWLHNRAGAARRRGRQPSTQRAVNTASARSRWTPEMPPTTSRPAGCSPVHPAGSSATGRSAWMPAGETPAGASSLNHVLVVAVLLFTRLNALAVATVCTRCAGRVNPRCSHVSRLIEARRQEHGIMGDRRARLPDWRRMSAR